MYRGLWIVLCTLALASTAFAQETRSGSVMQVAKGRSPLAKIHLDTPRPGRTRAKADGGAAGPCTFTIASEPRPQVGSMRDACARQIVDHPHTILFLNPTVIRDAVEMLADPDRLHCWTGVLRYLGVLGGAGAIKPVLATIQSGGGRDADILTVDVVGAGLGALAHISALGEGDPQTEPAAVFLMTCADPQRWMQADIAWLNGAPDRARLATLLAERCIVELGLAHPSAQARGTLRWLNWLKPVWPLGGFAAPALRRLDEIAKDGGLRARYGALHDRDEREQARHRTRGPITF